MSRPVLRHYGIMKAGIIHLHNLPLYQKNAAELEGKRIEFTVTEEREKPSVDQHAYYRGGVLETGLTAECFRGWTADQLHAFFIDGFFGIDRLVCIKLKNGQTIERIIRDKPSLADLGKKDMAEYIDKCISFLAIEGVVVHTPEQYKLAKFKTIYKNG